MPGVAQSDIPTASPEMWSEESEVPATDEPQPSSNDQSTTSRFAGFPFDIAEDLEWRGSVAFGPGDSGKITLDAPSEDGLTAILEFEMRNAKREETSLKQCQVRLNREGKSVISIVPDSDYTVLATSILRTSGSDRHLGPTLHTVKISAPLRGAMRPQSVVELCCCGEGSRPTEPGFKLVYPRDVDLAASRVSLWARSVGRPVEPLGMDGSVLYRTVPDHPQGFEPPL